MRTKQFLIDFYKEYVQWSICMYIRFLKENKYPYQYQHWEQQLKNMLNTRKKILLELDSIQEYKQLTLF